MSDTEYIRLLEEQVKDLKLCLILMKEQQMLSESLIESFKKDLNEAMAWRAEQ